MVHRTNEIFHSGPANGCPYTTGLHPVPKPSVWSLIRRIKSTRTTLGAATGLVYIVARAGANGGLTGERSVNDYGGGTTTFRDEGVIKCPGRQSRSVMRPEWPLQPSGDTSPRHVYKAPPSACTIQ